MFRLNKSFKTKGRVLFLERLCEELSERVENLEERISELEKKRISDRTAEDELVPLGQVIAEYLGEDDDNE